MAESFFSKTQNRQILGVPLNHFLLFLICAICAGLFYSSFWPDAPYIIMDAKEYMYAGQHISEFNIFTPGYPLLLLLTGSSVEPSRALFYLQFLLQIFSIFLLLRLLHRLTVSSKLIIPFMIILFFPPIADYAAGISSENLTQFLLVTGSIGLLAWINQGRFLWLILSAVAFAYSGITRPTNQLLSISIAILLLSLPLLIKSFRPISKRFVTAAITLAIAAILIVGGLIFRNYRSFDYAALTPFGG